MRCVAGLPMTVCAGPGSGPLGAATADLHAYDIASASWTDLTTVGFGTLPAARYAHGTAAFNGKLYVYGGRPSQLHPPTHTLTNPPIIQPLILGTSERGLGAVVRADSSPWFNDLHAYDVATATWTILSTPTAGVATGEAGMAAFDDKIYVFYGYAGALPPLLSVRAAMCALLLRPFARPRHAPIRPVRDAACQQQYTDVGGAESSTTVNTNFHAYDIASGAWTELPAPNGGTLAARGQMGFAVYDSAIYLYGGIRGEMSSLDPTRSLLGLADRPRVCPKPPHEVPTRCCVFHGPRPSIT